MALSNAERCRRWKERNPEAHRAALQRYKRKHPDLVRKQRREASWRRAGIKPTHPCPDNCEGCLRHHSLFKKHFALDHDHVTKEVRGWLCSDCNSTLGFVKDNPDTLRRLANYLERSNPLAGRVAHGECPRHR